MSSPIYDFTATSIDGAEIGLDRWRNHVLLIVNVASACGYTPQYAGLERLYRQHKDRGLVVLGFPCNQFGRQEPGSNEDIQGFCSDRYDVTFPMFAKIKVNGSDAHPLYAWLKAQKTGRFGLQSIRWNFYKFLVNRQGDVLRRYPSTAAPDAIEPDVMAALAVDPSPELRP